MPSRDFLKQRNALWRQLRTQTPGTPGFEATLADLAALTGWTRAQLLAGLGLTDAEAPPPGARP